MPEREIYPLHLKVFGDIENGMCEKTTGGNILIDSFGAIKIEIEVNSANYPKNELYKAVRETALKAAEYFH